VYGEALQEAAHSEMVATGQLVTVDHSVRVIVKVWMVSKLGEEDVTKVAEASKPIAKRVEAMSDRQKKKHAKMSVGIGIKTSGDVERRGTCSVRTQEVIQHVI
jgi:hypothetical protein